ncbi:glycine betaine ABC transporter substrate-binding protein [Kineosporia babensis]|uniref:Glycine betaine ABC transporter substrate-binding protein n=1 Tax=Kineosporia babensis TaxID=499548 RepID=A0A9X1ND15_9ACTN|nr:glycine betaine ABC transporter substrate-binding protein [Kineosporia babensis]MCD5311016.1 glycine betaine ABC transporter substrate-binding protein [Kineosporia babensis]
MNAVSRRQALLLGLAAGALGTVSACSGQTAKFSGGSGGGDSGGSGDDDGGKSVSLALVAGWDDAIAVTYLWKELLEQRGYSVRIQELEIAAVFTGVANGQIDMYLDAWLPTTHQAYWDRFKDDLEVLSVWSSGVNVLAVPDYVSVSSLADLKGNAGEFGDRIVGVEAGGGLMTATREQVMPAYGLDQFTLVEGSSPAMLAALETAIKRKQAIAVTLWEPHWAFSRYPIKALEDPDAAFGEPDELSVIATKGFGANNPELTEWFKGFKLTPAQLGEIMERNQEAGQGNEQTAVKAWITENQAEVDGWFPA